MKKVLLLLLVVLCFGFLACKEQEKEPSSDPDNINQNTEDPNTNPSEGEPNEEDPKEEDPNEKEPETPKEVKYKIDFVVDGVIFESLEVLENTMPKPSYDGAKAEDDLYTYEFLGWSPDLEKATRDATYTAVFKNTEKGLKYSTLDGLKLSILGDSISTFYSGSEEPSSYYHTENTYYYPLYCKEVNSYSKTWWGQLINNTNMELGINNSWSGSTAGGSFQNAGWREERTSTLDDNGKMDIFIYYLGTNDLVNGHTKEVFKDAVTKTINDVLKLARCEVFLMTLGYSDYSGYGYTEEGRLSYNEALREIASEYGYGIIPLDEYIIEDNYSIYLHDRLHYNLKGTTLISKICEKSIKEYNGIAFTEEINVEHQEPLAPGVLGVLTATASSGFWQGTNYETNVYLYNLKNGEGETALYSTRIELDKKSDNTYVVRNIIQSGTSKSKYDGDYAIMISDAHKELSILKKAIKDVKVGTIATFDLSNGFPVDITFMDGDGESGTSQQTDPPVTYDGLHVGSYNTGIWSLYETTVFAYSKDALDQGSTYINFYVIGINHVENDTYRIDYLKDIDVATAFGDYEYYILIYRELESKSYFSGLKVNDLCEIIGDITSGEGVVKFK